MRRILLAALCLTVLVASGLPACSGSSPDGNNASGGTGATGAGGTGGTGGGSCGPSATDEMGNPLVIVSPTTNYSFMSRLSIGVTPVAPRSELTFDWSGVTADLTGHAVDPKQDLDMVTLLLWNLSEADLAEKLNADALAQADMEAIVTFETLKEHTSASIFEFTLLGTPVDQETLLNYLDPDTFDPETHSYTVMTATGTTPGKGTRMLRSFRLDPAATNTEVVIDSGASELDYSVDITALKPVMLPVGQHAIAFDWTDMTVNAMGNEFIPTDITRVMIGKYTQSVTELEEQFLDLETIGEELFRADLPSGTSAVLSTLRNENGDPFEGIDATHTWILALFCERCSNPAPWYLTVLAACP